MQLRGLVDFDVEINKLKKQVSESGKHALNGEACGSFMKRRGANEGAQTRRVLATF